jgi:hypothetical protein
LVINRDQFHSTRLDLLRVERIMLWTIRLGVLPVAHE